MINSNYFKSILKDIVYDLEKTFPYASALVLETSGERILVQTRQQSAGVLDPDRGAVLTVFSGRSFLEAATGDLSEEGLQAAAGQLKELGKDQGVFYDGPEIDPGPRMEEDFLVKPVRFPEYLPLKEKIQACTDLKDRLHKAEPRVVQATAQYAHVRTRELFINRHKVLFQDLRRTQMLAQVIMREGDRSVNLHTGQALQGGYEQAFIPEEKLNRLVEDCRKLLSAQRLEPGNYDCIFSPEFSGIFAHEAFGHGTETDMFLKKRAKGEEYLGRLVASPLVDMFDSPALPGQAASFFSTTKGNRPRKPGSSKRGS